MHSRRRSIEGRAALRATTRSLTGCAQRADGFGVEVGLHDFDLVAEAGAGLHGIMHVIDEIPSSVALDGQCLRSCGQGRQDSAAVVSPVQSGRVGFGQVGVRVHVERRRESPAPRFPDESVVAQVVVGVVDQRTQG